MNTVSFIEDALMELLIEFFSIIIASFAIVVLTESFPCEVYHADASSTLITFHIISQIYFYSKHILSAFHI